MPELTVYTSASDGYAYIQSAVSFLTARNAVAGNVVDDSSISGVGQSRSSTQWTIWRSYLFFDTSALPDGAIISAATLSIYVDIPYTSGGHYDIVIQNGQPTYPHDPLEQGDYLYTRYSGDGGSINSEDVDFNWNDIILNSDGRGWINKTGTTKLCLRTSKDINGNDIAEGTSSFLQLHTLEEGSAYRAKLVITYIEFTYAGTGGLAYSGTATQVYTTDFLYTGSGGFEYSGTATQSYTFAFAYIGTGGLSYSGDASYNFLSNFTYIGSGGFEYSGTATQSYTFVFAYVATGDITFSGIGTYILFAYVGDGSLTYSGSAVYIWWADAWISLTTPSKTYSEVTTPDNIYTPVSDVTPSETVEDKFTWVNIYPNYDTWLELLAKEHWADWYFGTAFTDAWSSVTT